MLGLSAMPVWVVVYESGCSFFFFFFFVCVFLGVFTYEGVPRTKK
jgi:hypothetical protein